MSKGKDKRQIIFDRYKTNLKMLNKVIRRNSNTLTCKSYNNIAGQKIDFHLTERLREIDSAKFIPGTETIVKVNIDGETFQGKITVAEDGTMTMFHSNNNHPINHTISAILLIHTFPRKTDEIHKITN